MDYFLPGTITRLWTDYDSDMNDLVEYQWQGRWTAKSLIVTPAEDSGLPLAYLEDRYIIPRATAQQVLMDKGYICHGRQFFYLAPWAMRHPQEAENIRLSKAAAAECEARYAALPQARRELINLYVTHKNLERECRSPEAMLTVNTWIEQLGEELVQAKITGRNYRRIDSAWEPCW